MAGDLIVGKWKIFDQDSENYDRFLEKIGINLKAYLQSISINLRVSQFWEFLNLYDYIMGRSYYIFHIK